jgi:hypothetical protein
VSEPVTTDKVAYVAGIYQEIEDKWLRNADDVANFQADLSGQIGKR